MGTKHERLEILVCSVAFAVIGLLSQASAAADPALVDAAKKEGQLNWYATTNVRDGAKFIKGFNKRYPFIQIQHLNMGSGQAINRVQTGTTGSIRFCFPRTSIS